MELKAGSSSVRRGDEGGLLRRVRLLVDAALRRQEGRREVDLETRKLNEGVEPVVVRLRLGQCQSVLAVL